MCVFSHRQPSFFLCFFFYRSLSPSFIVIHNSAISFSHSFCHHLPSLAVLTHLSLSSPPKPLHSDDKETASARQQASLYTSHLLLTSSSSAATKRATKKKKTFFLKKKAKSEGCRPQAPPPPSPPIALLPPSPHTTHRNGSTLATLLGSTLPGLIHFLPAPSFTPPFLSGL